MRAYIAARMMIASNYLEPVGLYNAHLACECMMKALIAQSGNRPSTATHNLEELMKSLRELNDDETLQSTDLDEIIEWLNPFQELGRYGALSRSKNDPNRKDGPNMFARGAVTWNPAIDIRSVDRIVSILRQLSSEAANDDIANIDTCFAMHSWNLPIGLLEVLYSENDYL